MYFSDYPPPPKQKRKAELFNSVFAKEYLGINNGGEMRSILNLKTDKSL